MAEKNHAPEVYVKRINAKEVLVVKERDKFISPCANGKIKLAGKGSQVRSSDQIRQGPETMEEHSRSDLAEQQQDAMEAKNVC